MLTFSMPPFFWKNFDKSRFWIITKSIFVSAKTEFGAYLSKLGTSLNMALCTPETNCSGERSFSCLKRFKNYLRSTLSYEKLNALSLLCIDSELMKKISHDDIIYDYIFKSCLSPLLFLTPDTKSGAVWRVCLSVAS